MTARLAVALTCALLGTGCVSTPLHRNTLKQANTLSDLYEQQVLDNLALFCANPDAVPSFAVPAGGVVSVQNELNAALVNQVTGNVFAFNQSGSATRTVVGNWSLAPVNDPDKLRLLRCLFRHVVGCPAERDCDHCQESLERYFGPDWAACAGPTGWFHVGCKKDVPRDVCAVGRYHDVFVWVAADGRDALARLTLSTLDVATIMFVVPPPPSKEVTTFEYRGDLLIRQEKRVVIDPVSGPRKRDPNDTDLKGLKGMKPEDLPASVRGTERRDYFDPYRGLFFAPR